MSTTLLYAMPAITSFVINHFNLFQSLGGNIISRATTSDLNPVLAAGGCILNLASTGTGAKTLKKIWSFILIFQNKIDVTKNPF